MIERLKSKVEYLIDIGHNLCESPKLILGGGSRIEEPVSVGQIFAIKSTESMGEEYVEKFFIIFEEVKVLEDNSDSTLCEDFYYWMLSKTDKYIKEVKGRFIDYLDDVPDY